jgi:ubiquinone/menaquinone biosynthesis C-methylase UbiE
LSDFDYSLLLRKRAQRSAIGLFSGGQDGPTTLLSHPDQLPRTIAARTRRIYDSVASIYPVSTFFFHSKAHACALRNAEVRNGMQVLEVATGSGEMFRRLVKSNPEGKTFGLDLSPNMAARTQKRARSEFPSSSSHCGAVDVRSMPFKDGSFDAVVCCYLFELLSQDDIRLTLREIRRVLRPGGTFALVVIGQNAPFFNKLYSVCGTLVPAFWGRQVDRAVPQLVREAGLRIVTTNSVKQSGYPSRVLVARR